MWEARTNSWHVFRSTELGCSVGEDHGRVIEADSYQHSGHVRWQSPVDWQEELYHDCHVPRGGDAATASRSRGSGIGREQEEFPELLGKNQFDLICYVA